MEACNFDQDVERPQAGRGGGVGNTAWPTSHYIFWYLSGRGGKLVPDAGVRESFQHFNTPRYS